MEILNDFKKMKRHSGLGGVGVGDGGEMAHLTQPFSREELPPLGGHTESPTPRRKPGLFSRCLSQGKIEGKKNKLVPLRTRAPGCVYTQTGSFEWLGSNNHPRSISQKPCPVASVHL